ncbi:MAG: tetratricopeptide repeat protein [Burkholderiales bacterium]
MLQQALALHRAGRLAEAAGAYRAILARDPAHREALRLLATLEAARGNADAALPLVARLHGVPADGPAACIALAGLAAGARRFDLAAAAYARAVALGDATAGTLNDGGIAFAQAGRLADALAWLERAVATDPAHAMAHANRGLVLQALGRHADALAAFDRALALQPDYPEAWNNRGRSLGALARHREALASFERALALRPDFPEAAANRAVAQQVLARESAAAPSGDAMEALARIGPQHPSYADARNDRGSLLLDAGRAEEALADYDRALAARPAFAVAHANRAKALTALGRDDEALAALDRALAGDAPFAEALAQRGALHAGAKRHAAAAADFERALALEPEMPLVPGLLLHARMQRCDWQDFAALRERAIAGARDGRRTASPLVMLSLTDDPAVQAACARAAAQAAWPVPGTALWTGDRYGHARLRIAYLSSDFDEHAVAFLLAGVLEVHDRARVEVVAVSSGRPMPDSPMRARIVRACDRFVDVHGRTDREVAQALRALEADVVVDLNGPTLGSRTGALAWRPAPVQVAYLGFPGTCGATFVDGLLADRFVVPAGERAHYVEHVVDLPEVFQANDRARAIAPVPARAAVGLADDAFVFCAFANSYKIVPEMFARWMRVLAAVPRGVLWLLDGDGVPEHLRAAAARAGVDPARLAFAPRLPYAAHLARYALADFALDTLPFNGGATVSDALWAGVPVLTTPGRAFAARMAGSLLTALGVPELVTADGAAYETQAIALAHDPARLAALRARVAEGRTASPVFDTARFTRHLEAVFAGLSERAMASGVRHVI